MVTAGDPYVAAARVYDLFYEAKDYASEAGAVVALAEQYAPGARTLLDVGCGTGVHLSHLAAHYSGVAGVDVSTQMLDQARASFPSIPFHQGDMRTFALEERFDVVTCLFSAIGYTVDDEALREAVANMARHVAPGGVLLVEGWVDPADWVVGKASANANVGDHAAAARVMLSGIDGAVSTIDMHYVIATLDGIDHVVEHHRLGLFTAAQYRAAVEDAGLRYAREEGLTGRGLHVGISRTGG